MSSANFSLTLKKNNKSVQEIIEGIANAYEELLFKKMYHCQME